MSRGKRLAGGHPPSSGYDDAADVARTASAIANHGGSGHIRTTIVLPEDLYWTLTAWCGQERLKKGDGVIEIIKAGLVAKGLQPDKVPKIKIEY